MKYIIDENEHSKRFNLDNKARSTVNGIMDLLQQTDLTIDHAKHLLHFCADYMDLTICMKDAVIYRYPLIETK